MSDNNSSASDLTCTGDRLLVTDELISLSETASKVGPLDSLRRYVLQGKLQAGKI